MAVISLNPVSVKHTLPAAYYGWNFAAFFHQDSIAASWQSAMNSIAPEIMRAHMWGYEHTYTGHDNCKNGFADLVPKPKISLQGDAFPASVPATLAPNNSGNRSGASGRSPASAVALIEEYIAAGNEVLWYEPYNEPTNCVDDVAPSTHSNEWYTSHTGYSAGQTDQQIRRHAETWAVVHGRFWNDAVKAWADAEPLTIKRLWFTWGSGGASSFNASSLIHFLDGTMPNGQSNPNASPSNMPYFEVLVIHAYPGGVSGGDQAVVNSYLYPSYVDGKGSIYAGWQNARTQLNSRGGSSKGIAFNEGPSLPDDRALGAFQDIVLAIGSAIYQSKFKLDHAVFHSANRGIVGDEGHSIFDPSVTPSTASMNTRALVHRDIISPFLRLYKQQLIGGASAANPPTEITGSGNTPATTAANSVPRIWCCAGKNAAGNKIGLIVANLDKTTSESVTIQFGTAATGNATYKQHDASAAGNKSAPLSGTLPTNGNNSHTLTVAAGDAYFIEVPISSAGDTTAPSLVTATVDGAALVLTYSETLNAGSEPLGSDYTVMVNGIARTVSAVDVVGSTAQLTLASPVLAGDNILLSYTRVGGREIEDPTGNLAANLSSIVVTNNTVPIFHPTGREQSTVRSFRPRTIGGNKKLGGGGV